MKVNLKIKTAVPKAITEKFCVICENLGDHTSTDCSKFVLNLKIDV